MAGDRDNELARKQALLLSIALSRFVRPDQSADDVEITLSVGGVPVAAVELSERTIEVLTDNLQDLADAVDAGPSAPPMDSDLEYALRDVVDNPDQEADLAAQIDEMFIEAEQQKVGYWDRAVIETVSLPYRTGSLEQLTTPVADLDLDDDDDLPIPEDVAELWTGQHLIKDDDL